MRLPLAGRLDVLEHCSQALVASELAFISSKIAGAANSDELAIRTDHPQFHQSGQKVSSRCRLSRLTTLALPLVRRRIGRLPEALKPACAQILREIVGAET